MHMNEIDIELLGEDLFNLLGLALAQQAVINKHAGHLLTDGTCAKSSNHRRINAAGKRQDNAVLAHRLAEIGRHALDQVIHGPVLLKARRY